MADNALKKILIVEDNEDLSFVVKTALEGAGYAVQTAGDGLQALERVKQMVYDLILLDLMLPKMDGCAVNLKLKENPQTAKIPVVVLTAYSHRQEFGAIKKDVTLAAYLQKPVPIEKLLTEIGQVLKPCEHKKKEKVLVIDDDEELCEMLSFGLTDAGYSPDIVKSGKQAKEYLSQKVPDVILADIMMPDMNGIELCQWIHSQPQTRDVPIIQMSALSNEAIIADSADTGVMDYIIKPVSFDTLKEKINLALTRARRRREEGMKDKG